MENYIDPRSSNISLPAFVNVKKTEFNTKMIHFIFQTFGIFLENFKINHPDCECAHHHRRRHHSHTPNQQQQ